MKPTAQVTDTELWEYLSKKASDAVTQQVVLWMASDNFDKNRFDKIEQVFKITGTVPVLHVNKAAAKDRFFDSVGAGEAKK